MTTDGHRQPARRLFPTIQRELLMSVTATVLIGVGLLGCAAAALIQFGLRVSFNRMLDTALELAGALYDVQFQRMTAFLDAHLEGPVVPQAAVTTPASGPVDVVLWLDTGGTPLRPVAAVPDALARLARRAAGSSGQPLVSSELLDRAWVEQVVPLPASAPPPMPSITAAVPVLAQVVAYAKAGGGPVVVAVRFVERHHSLTDAYARRIPDSFLSVAVHGVRVLSTIRTREGPVPPGSYQTADLQRAVVAGRTWHGVVRFMTGEQHMVAARPITSASGQVVAALSVGLPPAGFEPMQRAAFAALAAALILCLGLTTFLVNRISHRLTAPLGRLRDIAIQVTRSKDGPNGDELVAQLQAAQATVRTQELDSLATAFIDMSRSLERKNRETRAYLAQLQADHHQLQALTERLNEANRELEHKVTERTRELQAAVVELREANRQKSRFVANMSHELRTPLNSIIGFSEMLRDQLFGPLNAKQRQYVEIILTSAHHLLQVINDILDLSRIEQGRLEVTREPVAMADLVASVVRVVAHQVEEKGLGLSVDVPRELPVVPADPTRIKQVLYNLLSNAIKFTPSGGRIWVRALAEGDGVTVQVEDTGIGIARDNLPRVFDEFAQVEEGYRRRFEGVGLGLALSKRLVEMHGGRIAIDSDVGRGTVVSFSLPAPVDGAPAGSGGGAFDAGAGGGGQRV